MSYQIITDVTADLLYSAIDPDLIVIPMEFAIDGITYTHYLDARELSSRDFYDKIKAGAMASTSQINYATYMDIFEPILKMGRDILYIGFSSGLSGTYNASTIAVADLKEKYPERKIYTVDSLCASTGEALLVHEALKRKAGGMSIGNLVEWLYESRLKVCHRVMVDDLQHLKRGGRVSGSTAAVGNLLGIKPILHMSAEGKLLIFYKARGAARAFEFFISEMKKGHFYGDTAWITHANDEESALQLAKLLREELKMPHVGISQIGPVVGTHCGAGTIALAYFGDIR